VSLQVVVLPTTPLNETVLALVPTVGPKFVPLIVTTVPIGPDIGLMLLIFGGGVTVKGRPLLAMPLTVTTTFPVVAPAGTVVSMLVALQAVGVAGVPLKVIDPGADPKLEPVMVMLAPMGPCVRLRVERLGGARLVNEKFAEVAPVALATTLYGPPAVLLAVNVADVATPLALVVAVFTPPANVPLAPLPGAVNVTTTPVTGLFPASVTVATNGAPNAVLIAALCPDPLVAATLAAGPTVLVSEKFAGVATPATDAATV